MNNTNSEEIKTESSLFSKGKGFYLFYINSFCLKMLFQIYLCLNEHFSF